MNVTQIDYKDKSTVILTIHVEAADFTAAVEQAYQNNKANITVPGFEKGEATREAVEKEYGDRVFYEEAINIVSPRAFEAAVNYQRIDAVGYPEVEILEAGIENGLTFKATVTLRPVATIKNYKGLSAPKAQVTVTNDDVEQALKPLIQKATQLVAVDRAVINGDTAVIDFEGFDNGVPFEGGKGEKYSLGIGSHSFVPGFEEQIIGMLPGEEKDIHITFPQNYHPGLAGKPVVFHVKVHEVKESQAPAVDDAFAKSVSSFETLAELKKDLAEKLTSYRESEAQANFENAIIAQLVENMEVTIPETMINLQLDRVMQDFERRLSAQGMKLEDYVKMTGGTMEDLRNSGRPAAKRQVEMELAFTAVAQAENIQIPDEELEAELKNIAKQYNMEEDKVRSMISPELLKKDMAMRKASQLVLAEAKAL